MGIEIISERRTARAASATWIARKSESSASIRDRTFREKPGKPELGRKTNSAAQKHANTPLVEQLDV